MITIAIAIFLLTGVGFTIYSNYKKDDEEQQSNSGNNDTEIKPKGQDQTLTNNSNQTDINKNKNKKETPKSINNSLLQNNTSDGKKVNFINQSNDVKKQHGLGSKNNKPGTDGEEEEESNENNKENSNNVGEANKVNEENEEENKEDHYLNEINNNIVVMKKKEPSKNLSAYLNFISPF